MTTGEKFDDRTIVGWGDGLGSWAYKKYEGTGFMNWVPALNSSGWTESTVDDLKTPSVAKNTPKWSVVRPNVRRKHDLV